MLKYYCELSAFILLFFRRIPRLHLKTGVKDSFNHISNNVIHRSKPFLRIFNCFAPVAAIFFFIIIFPQPLTASTFEILLAYEDKDNYPEQIGNTTETNIIKPGVSVEFYKILCERLSIQAKFKRMPWKRCLEVELKNDLVDGVFNVSYSPERENFGAFPKKEGNIDVARRYSTVSYYFYKLKDSDFSWDGTIAHNVSGNIGAPAGYSIVEDLKKMGCGVETSPETISAMKKLITGRICAVAALEGEGDAEIAKNPEFSKFIQKIRPPLLVKHYYLVLSHGFVEKNRELSEKIWNTVGELRESERSRILLKYKTKPL